MARRDEMEFDPVVQREFGSRPESMIFQKLKYRSREVLAAVAITVAAVGAIVVLARHERSESPQPVALVTPKK